MAQAKCNFRVLAMLLGMASAVLAVDRQTFLKRVGDSEGMKAGLAAWGPALKNATGEEVDAFALFTLLGELDPLWNKEHKFQKEASMQMLARMQTVNQATLANWQSAFEKATGDRPTKPNSLILIVQLNRIFDKATLKENEGASLLGRLKSLPEPAATEWAELTKQKRQPAAAQLITLDGAFETDAFQEKPFKRLCEELKAKQK